MTLAELEATDPDIVTAIIRRVEELQQIIADRIAAEVSQ